MRLIEAIRRAGEMGEYRIIISSRSALRELEMEQDGEIDCSGIPYWEFLEDRPEGNTDWECAYEHPLPEDE